MTVQGDKPSKAGAIGATLTLRPFGDRMTLAHWFTHYERGGFPIEKSLADWGQS
jgi:hypothetical protein